MSDPIQFLYKAVYATRDSRNEMMELGEFEHGRYGDYSGVCFYAQPAADQRWDDRLAISDRYIDPLFRAIIDRASRRADGTPPKLVADWNPIQGWADATGPVVITPQEARDLLDSLDAITPADLLPHSTGTTPEACLRCAATIRHFLQERLASGKQLFIQHD